MGLQEVIDGVCFSSFVVLLDDTRLRLASARIENEGEVRGGQIGI